MGGEIYHKYNIIQQKTTYLVGIEKFKQEEGGDTSLVSYKYIKHLKDIN